MRGDWIMAAENSGRFAMGHGRGGFLFVILFILFIILIVGIIRRVVMMRRMRKAGVTREMMLSQRFGGKEMSKSQAGMIVVRHLKKQGASVDEIRQKLIDDYGLEALIADALIYQAE